MIRRYVQTAARFARREALAVGAFIALLMLAGGFLEIAGDVAEGDTQSVDRSVLMALREHAAPHDPIGPDWLTTAAADLTALGSVAVLVFVVLTVVGLFLALGRRRQAGVLLAASIGGLIWSESVKAMIGRTRPEEMFRIVEAHNASFPSGHSLLSASVYLTIAALAASFARRRSVRAVCLAAGLTATGLVGATRVFLGVHWPSDVLAGWCLGGGWALFCWLCLWAYERTRPTGTASGG